MLMRTDPFREFDRLADLLGPNHRLTATPIDAFRKGDTFLVQFDLPGVRADSIDLTVRAERVRPEHDGVEMLLAERPHGTFTRQLFLGETLDTERLEAEYVDGVLTVRLPVAESAKPRKVAINAQNGAQASISV
jgi:HSP20 family protein